MNQSRYFTGFLCFFRSSIYKPQCINPKPAHLLRQDWDHGCYPSEKLVLGWLIDAIDYQNFSGTSGRFQLHPELLHDLRPDRDSAWSNIEGPHIQSAFRNVVQPFHSGFVDDEPAFLSLE